MGVSKRIFLALVVFAEICIGSGCKKSPSVNIPSNSPTSANPPSASPSAGPPKNINLISGAEGANSNSAVGTSAKIKNVVLGGSHQRSTAVGAAYKVSGGVHAGP